MIISLKTQTDKREMSRHEVVQIPEVCPGGSLAGSPRTWGFALEVSPGGLPSEVCAEGSLPNLSYLFSKFSSREAKELTR